MPKPTTDRAPAPSAHAALIERKLPEWLRTAPPASLQGLRQWRQAPAWLAAAVHTQPLVARAWAQEHARHRQHQAQVQQLFASLPDLHDYARRLLSEAISARFGVSLDVEANYLLDARLIDSTSADLRQAAKHATRSLLQCALHNFAAGAAAPGGMDGPTAPLKRSVLLDHRRFMGAVPIGNALALAPEAFAGLCRSLDIGGQYHALLHAIYYPPAAAEALAVYQTLGRAEASAFHQALHFARLKGDIDAQLYAAALATPLAEAPAAPDAAVSFKLMSLWEVELTGVVVMQLRGDSRVALYIPADEATPLKAFASLQALEDELSARLRADSGYLDRHIPERDKAAIQARLAERLAPLGWSRRGMHEPVADPDAALHPRVHGFSASFVGTLAFQKVQRHEQDAVFHAVPTHVVDLRTAKAHHQLIASRSLGLLNIAGFFVPGLGEAMLAVCVLQLADEVYEGLHSWANDEQDVARDYLVDVIENLAAIAAFAAAAAAFKAGVEAIGEGAVAERPRAPLPVDTPSFIEELEEVELPDGTHRVWKPDLAPYRSALALPATLEPDPAGLVPHAGRRWLRLEQAHYAVEASAAGEYRLAHPNRPEAYQPRLRHNGAGAWLLPTEQPLRWPLATLLQRLGEPARGLPEAALRQAMQISDTTEDALRHALSESLRLPALFEDCLLRIKLDQAVGQASAAFERSARFERAYRRLPPSQAPGAATIQRSYPGLPATLTDELLRHVDASERQSLASGKLPLRLAEEIRVYRQQLRLARAYEGVFLQGVRSWDSDRLILHALARLPGWPGEVRVELRQRRFWPSQQADIGPALGARHCVISSVEAGYLAERPGLAVSLHATLPDALASALPDAMAALGAADGTALRQLLQQAPPLPRATLRQLLGMQPVRRAYRSPMRLANGRLGYALSGGGPAGAPGMSRQRLLEAVRATGLSAHTRRSENEILMLIAAPGRTQAQVLERLQALSEARDELQSRLDDWSEGIAPASDQAAQRHRTVHEAIMQHWYDSALDEHAEHSAVLSLEQVPLADIPMNLPLAFTSRVRRLRLHDLAPQNLASWAQHERLLQRLLRQFADLQELEIDRPYNPRATPSSFLLSLPSITEHAPGLRALSLTNQNIALTATDLDLLAGLPELRRLDLRGNRFAQHNSPSFHELSLDYLGLDDMQISQWPIGLGSDALARIAHVSLRNNNLRSLPAFLLNEPDSALQHSVLSLQGNPINEDHLQRLLLNQSRHTWHVNVDRSPALSERLQRLHHERQQLREALDGWVHASSSNAPLTEAMLEDRERIEAAINRFWDSQERGLQYLRLQLAEVALENFPRRLPAFFNERVNAMSLSGTRGSTAQLDTLLARFPNITRLSIDGHLAATPSLPSALARLPRLAHLEFRNLGLEVDQAMLEAFARLPQLTTLDLSGNRMGVVAQVPPRLAERLSSLSLSNMGLDAWPAWCEALLPLELLDLSSNNISQLPEMVLQNLENPMPISSISLFDNPLSDDTILRARAFSESQHSFTFALDIPDNLLLTDTSDDGSLLDHPHFPLLGDDTPRLEAWTLGTALQNEALQDAWQTLQQSEPGTDLLRLVGRLRNAAPYVDPTSQGEFCERVRMMLVTAASHEELRPNMSAIGAEGLPDPLTGAQTCHDGALQAFNNIELFLMHNRLLVDAGDSLQALHRRLLQLFRMGQLELLANRRTAQGDHVSVRLAYRRELASELDLPIADAMRFRGAAMLAPGELASVLEQVRERESGAAFMQYMLANEYWTARLRGEYAERFSQIEEHFGERVLEVAALDLPLAEELALQQRLLDEKCQQELELLEELTRLYAKRS